MVTFKGSCANDFTNAVANGNEFGQTITFTAPDAAAYTPTGIAFQEVTRRRETEQGTILVHTRKIKIAAGAHADFDAATSVAMNMTVTIDTLVYAVENFHRDEFGVMHFDIARAGTNEHTRSGYRRRLP